jgi:hypothetical protein
MSERPLPTPPLFGSDCDIGFAVMIVPELRKRVAELEAENARLREQDRLRVQELADTDAALADANERCDRLKADAAAAVAEAAREKRTQSEGW